MNKNNWKVELFRRLWVEKFLVILSITFTILAAAIGSTTPIFVGKLIDIGIENDSLKKVIIFALLIVSTLLMVEFFNGVRRYSFSTLVLRFTRKLTIDVLKRVSQTHGDFFKETQKGEIIQRCLSDTQALKIFSLETLPTFLFQLIQALFSLIAVYIIYWPIGIISTFIYFIYIFPVHYYGNKQKNIVSKLNNQEAQLKQMFLEKHRKIRMIKLLGAEDFEFSNYSEEQKKWSELTYRRYLNDNIFRNFPRVLDSLVPALVFGVGGYQVFNGILSIGDLIAITQFLPAINKPTKSFTLTFLAFKDIGIRLERVTEYLYLPIEAGSMEGLKIVNMINGEIEFDRVSLNSSRGKVLSNVSFKINKGEHVAIVGPSGAGKSTLLRLLTMMSEQKTGSIMIDGIPLEAMDATSYRKRIGIINQDTFLFNDNILNNLLYLSEGSKEQLIKMTEILECQDFILDQRLGYKTIIGNNGTLLSGGQRQRLSIIRTLMKKYDILFLDEITSGLDLKNELIVQNAVRMLAKNKTCVFVAHRLQTVVDADRILVFDRGKIVEEGTHNSLLERKGTYFRLWSAQMDVESWEIKN